MKQVYFDTNFLLRFYLKDNLSQALKAKDFVKAALDGKIILVTDLIVICEMVWVMDSVYRLDRKNIVEKIFNLIQTSGIRIIKGDILPSALNAYLEKNVDFTDAIIATSAIQNNISVIASFDKKHMSRWHNSDLRRIESLDELK